MNIKKLVARAKKHRKHVVIHVRSKRHLNQVLLKLRGLNIPRVAWYDTCLHLGNSSLVIWYQDGTLDLHTHTCKSLNNRCIRPKL